MHGRGRANSSRCRKPSSVRFKGSTLNRANRRGLARNAAVVLGNVGTSDDLPLFEAALQHDEVLVREHAAWAIAQVRDHLSR